MKHNIIILIITGLLIGLLTACGKIDTQDAKNLRMIEIM